MSNWQPDWKTLQSDAENYKNTSPLVPGITATTPVDGFVFTGLVGNLTDIVKSAVAVANPLTGGLVIAVDTLIIDSGDTAIPASGVEIIARSLQVSEAGSASVTVTGGSSPSVQISTAEIVGTLSVVLGTGNTSLDVVLTENKAPPQVLTFFGETPTFSNDPTQLADVLHSPAGVLALELSFAAAGALVEQNDSDAMALAANMLRWVSGGVYALIQERSNFSNLDINNLASLQSNTVGLLSFTQASASGASYVPVLSAEIYQTEITALLNVAGVYDQKIQAFEKQQNLDELLKSFAGTLKGINEDAEAPLFNTLKRLANETAAVQSQLANDALQLQNISETLKPLQEALEKAIQDQFQAELAEAGIKAFFTVVTLYLSVGAILAGQPELLTAGTAEAAKAAMEIAEKLAEAGEQVISGAIHEGTTSASGPPTLKTVGAVEQGAQALMGAQATFGEAVSALWTVVNEAIAGGQNRINYSPDVLKEVEKIPDLSGFSIGGTDPVTYWDAVVVQVKASVKPFASGEITGPAVTAYLEAVELASTYGKGVGDQQMKMLDLYNQGMSAFDRLRAIYQAEAKWTALQGELDQQEARIAAAKGFLQKGYTDIRRNLIVAVNNYRAAFQYQWLQPSTVIVNASMSYLQLVQAAENSITGLQNVLKGTSSGAVRPRQKFNKLVYHVRPGKNPLFSEVNGKGQARWAITLDDDQLSSQINGNTAIYLTEATFVLEGSSQSAEVELQITTSPDYANKLADKPFRFVSSAITMASDYDPGDPPLFKTTWQFADEASYLKPSPYTQWTLVVDQGNWEKVTSIKMTLAGLFLQNP